MHKTDAECMIAVETGQLILGNLVSKSQIVLLCVVR